MIEVFKTNVASMEEANRLAEKILLNIPNVKVNFDLEDCDKILRVEGTLIKNEEVIKVTSSLGFRLEELT